MKKYFIILVFAVGLMSAEINVINTQMLDMGGHAINPVFSADGNYLLYGTEEGLFTYDLKKNRSLRFANTGFDPIMDEHGIIRYRVDNFDKGYRLSSFSEFDPNSDRKEIVLKDIRLQSAPKITDHGFYYVEKDHIKSHFGTSTLASKPVAFTLDNKVIMYSYGTSKILAPAGDRPHLWPSISPDQDKFCVVGGKDLYICDMNGNILSEIKDMRAPQWSPDGKWIACMRDTDNGETYTGSDIYIISADGQSVEQITYGNDVIEMYPQWSPDGKQIICDNPVDGKPVLLTLEIK